MYKATKEIYEAFMEKNLRATVEEKEGMSAVVAGFPLENGAPILLRFISTDDDNDVAVRVVQLIRVEEERAKAILGVLNDLNVRYRGVKFTLDKDNDVNVQFDFPLACGNVKGCALETTARFIKIIRQAYPELMRTIWQ